VLRFDISPILMLCPLLRPLLRPFRQHRRHEQRQGQAGLDLQGLRLREAAARRSIGAAGYAVAESGLACLTSPARRAPIVILP
jgi:hypothetical protein